ncbi:DcaP family trimeric outer membrane transporter [Pseudoalteromonas sp.]|uniref:DcaP family trimeric outer membrane transporter n=1 Tax=Pseudoalteromonas sp. TaxID=53249 RepID=UPI00356A36C1
MKNNNLTITTLSVLAVLVGTSAQAGVLESTDVKYGGYIKLDAMWSDWSAGTVGGTSIGRDFYVPSTTPVGSDANTDPVFDMHARQSRFNFATSTKLDNSKSINTKIELDFIASPGGNERVTNSYAPRIRQAFVTYNGFLFGQAWSNFQNVSALPETLDFVGPAEGTVFVRQAMVKYTSGGFSVSAENPESTITTTGGVRNETDDSSLPDITARYTFKGDWGHFTIAGLARQLTYKAGGADASTSSFGVSASGRMDFGKNNLKYMVTTGKGLGRYVGLNVAHGAVLNGNDLDAIDSISGFIGYQHHWSDKLRSTFLASYFSADNNQDLIHITKDPTKTSMSYSANLLYSPEKKMTFGVEYKVGERETESGADGDINRLQLSAKYVF